MIKHQLNFGLVMTTTRGAGKDEQGNALQELVSHSTVNRTMQTFRAALYYVRDHHKAFIQPNLKFGVTKEDARKREPSDAEEAVLVDGLREDYHDIFTFALLSGIRETGLCMLERSKVDLVNAQVTFQSKRHRDDPPGLHPLGDSGVGPARSRAPHRNHRRTGAIRQAKTEAGQDRSAGSSGDVTGDAKGCKESCKVVEI